MLLKIEQNNRHPERMELSFLLNFVLVSCYIPFNPLPRIWLQGMSWWTGTR